MIKATVSESGSSNSTTSITETIVIHAGYLGMCILLPTSSQFNCIGNSEPVIEGDTTNTATAMYKFMHSIVPSHLASVACILVLTGFLITIAVSVIGICITVCGRVTTPMSLRIRRYCDIVVICLVGIATILFIVVTVYVRIGGQTFALVSNYEHSSIVAVSLKQKTYSLSCVVCGLLVLVMLILLVDIIEIPFHYNQKKDPDVIKYNISNPV